MCIKDRQWEAWYNGFKAVETSSYDGLNLAKKYSKDYVLAYTDYLRLWPQNKTYPESWLSTYQPHFFHKWNPSLPNKKQFLSISKLQTAQYSIWIMRGNWDTNYRYFFQKNLNIICSSKTFQNLFKTTLNCPIHTDSNYQFVLIIFCGNYDL